MRKYTLKEIKQVVGIPLSEFDEIIFYAFSKEKAQKTHNGYYEKRWFFKEDDNRWREHVLNTFDSCRYYTEEELEKSLKRILGDHIMASFKIEGDFHYYGANKILSFRLADIPKDKRELYNKYSKTYGLIPPHKQKLVEPQKI